MYSCTRKFKCYFYLNGQSEFLHIAKTMETVCSGSLSLINTVKASNFISVFKKWP